MLVRTVLDEFKEKGSYVTIWNGTDNNGAIAASGIYFYRIKGLDKLPVGRVVAIRLRLSLSAFRWVAQTSTPR